MELTTSGSWQVQVRRKGESPTSKTFSTKVLAEQWARSIENQIDRGIFVDRTEAERTTFAELIDRYLIEDNSLIRSRVATEKDIVSIHKAEEAALKSFGFDSEQDAIKKWKASNYYDEVNAELKKLIPNAIGCYRKSHITLVPEFFDNKNFILSDEKRYEIKQHLNELLCNEIKKGHVKKFEADKSKKKLCPKCEEYYSRKRLPGEPWEPYIHVACWPTEPVFTKEDLDTQTYLIEHFIKLDEFNEDDEPIIDYC